MKSLYIFVDSERPDQYLNSLVYCALRCDVRKVKFVHIKGLGAEGKSIRNIDGLSGRVMSAVQVQLEGLAERGEYVFMSGPRSGERVLLKADPKARATEVQLYYKSCRDIAISYSNEEIDYLDLQRLLKTIAKTERGAYVDITAIKKRYVGDIVAAALVEGLAGLYTFDLLSNVQPNFDQPWQNLVHELEASNQAAFQYVNIVDTAIYRKCAHTVVVRAPRLAISAISTVAFSTAVALGYWYLGAQSPWTQTFFAVSGAASVLSVMFVFFTPRSSL
ncbi:hypothetical protein [Nannocystis sp. SCPEA4]|uniref:hypothetical protein n=1 Tax=Nannocystis sp. SCPEA4 TaxID=2996787 RepID=UPI00226F1D96|nr:hypothetical protein [Nannocystis sp. SCPEA4]MCY1060154.1 hypothetical protein [Nannocystis sp. SCPEA4]